jgi:hypothetical protein
LIAHSFPLLNVTRQVISFLLMMRPIFLEHIGQRALPKEDQLVQALASEGADPAFGIRVQIRALRRQFDGFDARRLQDLVKTLGKFGVPVVEQIAGAGQLACDPGDIARDLFNPELIGRVGQPAQHNLARPQMNEKEHVNGDQSGGRPDFGGKEIRGPEHLLVAPDEFGPGGMAPPLRGCS